MVVRGGANRGVAPPMWLCTYDAAAQHHLKSSFHYASIMATWGGNLAWPIQASYEPNSGRLPSCCCGPISRRIGVASERLTTS